MSLSHGLALNSAAYCRDSQLYASCFWGGGGRNPVAPTPSPTIARTKLLLVQGVCFVYVLVLLVISGSSYFELASHLADLQVSPVERSRLDVELLYTICV
jgi:hypothetical protein